MYRRHAAYIHRFHLLFPLPRASISSFSPLSHTSSLPSSSSLIPPIPSIVLPGNHDLGLSSPSSPSSASASLGAYHRERFTAAFGPTYGEREWNGWRIVWVDAMALVEEEFWSGDEGGGEGGNYGGMKGWLEGMLNGPSFTSFLLSPHLLPSPFSPPSFLSTETLIPTYSPQNPAPPQPSSSRTSPSSAAKIPPAALPASPPVPSAKVGGRTTKMS